MKWFILSIIILLSMIPVAIGIEECQRVVEPEDIPCSAITTWAYPLPCINYSVEIFNQSGNSLQILNLTSYGTTGLCSFNFTHSTKGTYVYNVSSGDTGVVVVEVKNMLIALIIGIAVICGVLFWFASMLSDEHIFFKILIYAGSIYMLTIIPSAFIVNDVTIILYKSFMRLIQIFVVYIFVYLIYKLLVKLGAIVPGENKNNG